LADTPFRQLVETDDELKELRARYSALPADQRRQAAQWAYDSAQASTIMAWAINGRHPVHPAWHHAAIPLAIDPEFAPAILTVGSLEYLERLRQMRCDGA
jgi:hypothetical protein